MKTLLLLLVVLTYQVNAQQITKTLYQFPDSVTTCEANFRNLFHNWTDKYVTNANEFELLNYCFVEEIADYDKYKYYLNYCSSNKYLGASKRGRTWQHVSHLVNTRGAETLVRVYRNFDESIDTTDRPASIIALIHDDSFQKELLQLWNNELEFEAEDKAELEKSYSVNIDEMTADELKKCLFENVKMRRFDIEERFRSEVKLDDLVYAILFRFRGELFTHFVICSGETKQVVYDSVFSGKFDPLY